MSEISAKDVMALRAKTGLGMMECKKALAESGGDMEAAEDALRRKLKGKMDARVARAAGEGRIEVAVSDDGRHASIVELRAETDFTAKNDEFISMARKIAQLGLSATAGQFDPSDDVVKAVDDLRIKTGENISFARGHKLEGSGDTAYGTYVHHDGKTGVLVQGSGSISDATLRDVCMHITAAIPRPLGVSADDIPSDRVEKERSFALEEAMSSGKPKEIAEKMVEGKMRKYFESVALLEQPFVKNPDQKIKDLVGGDASIVEFFRWEVGEEA